MQYFPRFLLMTPCLLLFVPVQAAADGQATADEQLLRALNLPTDGPELVEFFKKRTLRDGDRPKIQALIRKLGDDEFDVREKSMQELVSLGAVAKSLLQEALKDKDIEIVRRVEKCVALADKTSTSEALGAAVRQLARKPVAGAAVALLDFLPFVEDESVVDEFGVALARTGFPDNQPLPELTTALSDKQVRRRAVAAEALGRVSRRTEALRRAAHAMLHDPDVQVRRRAAFGLVAAQDREAVPVLIALLAELPPAQLYRVEEVLFDLAGDKAPAFTGRRSDEEGRKKYRDVWAAWWKENETKVDLAKLGTPKPYLGYTLLCHTEIGRGRRVGKVYELDAAGKVRWELENISYPLDAQVLPNGNVLVTEQSGRVITERTLKNEIVSTHSVPSLVVGMRRLPNGNTFIAARNQLSEIDRDGKDVWSISRNVGDIIISAARLPSGGAVILTNQGRIVTLDATGKELKSFNVGPIYYGSQIDVLPGGRVLVPLYSQNKVVEYDAAGKSVWEANAVQPTCVQRLANGNTLISSRINTTITELNRAGEIVWTHQVANARSLKASRR